MYICYLDESGTLEPGTSTGHFVLIGLAIPADTWREKDNEIEGVKREFGLSMHEIHTSWMLRTYPEQNRIPEFSGMKREDRRRAVLGIRALNLGRPRTNKKQSELIKNYRKTEAYIHLSLDERTECVQNLTRMIGRWGDSRLFGEAHDKMHSSGAQAYDRSFEQVVTRFNTFLSIAAGQHGLLVQDNNETVSRRLTVSMRRYHIEGTLWSHIDHIVETPLFVDSRLTSMVQMADLCAYLTRRFFDNGEAMLFDKIYDRFDRNKGRLVGLRHFTGTSPCKCRVCQDHGRK